METDRSRAPAPLPRNVKLLGLASLLNDVASEMIVPLLPKFILGLAGGRSEVLGLIEGLADSATSLLKLASGKWSDRSARRKPWVVVGYGVAAVARPLVALATLPWHVLAVRVTDRAGKGLRTAPRDAMIVDATPSGQLGRAFGFHRAMDHLGAATGPLVGLALLALWPGEVRTVFALAAIPGALVVLLVLLGLREERPRAVDYERHAATAPSALRPRGFKRYLAALLLFSLGNSSDLFLLAQLDKLGADSAALLLLWTAFHAIKSSGNLLAGRAVDRFGPRPLLAGGWALYAAVYLGFGLAGELWQGVLLFFAYGLYYSLAEPAEKTLVAQLGIPKQMGAAYGWFNLVIGIAAFPASYVFGWLYDRGGPMAAFGWGVGLALASLAVMATVPRGGVKTVLGD